MKWTHTAAKWPAVIDSPIANGADPLISERRSSHTPWTTNTNMNVINASIRTPWISSTPVANAEFPNPSVPFIKLFGVTY